ncbi:MAG TPA: regulatory iron-sulfur-containing complex subunit RicT [Anaerolineales bacterium]|nr:regulatory iron-sulfur-containing complex subunit RicT [Anaerolineales bacterium]
MLVVGLRFQKVGKVYHFDSSNFPDLASGDFAIVETKRGTQLGQVVQKLEEESESNRSRFKPIQRQATQRDLLLRQAINQKEIEATINCRAKVSELGITGVKIVASEYSFDGSHLTFLYSTEDEAKLNLKRLRQGMAKYYPRVNLEFRLIGPRDVAKILGGMGACGLESRCCSQFLTEFSPISIKMAKEQGISLDPSEITGMCGRLRCCLIYEYEQYVAARKELPKRGKRVMTPKGEGRVIDVLPLTEMIIVAVGDEGRFQFMRHELEPWDELEALKRKAEGPCDRHENGGCDCGKS